ncbi:GTP cyclohydrolase IIa [Terrihalobacillus insolitus]|uniref:GTP cyclohydrolase IIa n=1 Tax=Terrihalobacillus insolitus TaxID=2950438 RepID=UPI002341616D|nr:GTP cyclohydrolase IIa [Terrihalobacillus insolitus]MDC3412169.1 GTP cyclohydrolase IIa [Terrihalobacillus insolitus]
MELKNSIKEMSEIVIGIIGPTEIYEQIKTVLKSFPNFKPMYLIVNSNNQFKEDVIALMSKVDVVMFTEYHLYYMAKQHVDFNIPVHHVPLMGTGLYKSLFLIKNIHGLTNLSVDSIDQQYVNQILYELEEEECEMYVYKNQFHSFSVDGIVQFHQDNHRKNGSIVLTGVQEVSTKLSELHIPNELVTPTNQDMIVSLERALLATETRRNKESQIVFGLIDIDNFQKVTEKYTSEHDVQLLKLQIQQILLDYIKQLDGHLVNLGGEEYLFITTRGIFERETRGYKFLPLLKDMKSEIGITLSLGVGFGQSAAEAGNHARLALRQSKELGGNICYIVREDRSVIGPVDITSQTHYEQYELSITDAKLFDKAEKAGMSAAYMAKLMARVKRHNKIDYTAQELASTLNVTIRSAHRILLKWMDAELVDIIGEEKVTYKGRPRRIYRLSFINEEQLSV